MAWARQSFVVADRRDQVLVMGGIRCRRDRLIWAARAVCGGSLAVC